MQTKENYHHYLFVCISCSLKLMAKGDKDGKAVFKGGTSLSKAYGIGARFSDDIDVAIAEAWTLKDNQLRKSKIVLLPFFQP